jgi:hypothetical protein
MKKTLFAIAGILMVLMGATPAQAGCGCEKPPPPRAAVRPFVGYPDMSITLFNDALVAGLSYQVQFISRDGQADWSRGKVASKRDLADGVVRPQLRAKVGNVSLGPCRIAVWSNGTLVFSLGEDQFTVTAPPIALHQFSEDVERDGYQAGVGSDGTVYLAVDVSQVSAATTFTGVGVNFPLVYGPSDIAMYNTQGFLMQLLEPTNTGLFRIDSGTNTASSQLAYRRHEFATYKMLHRQHDGWRTEDDLDWHVDGTRHIDHDLIFVAVSGYYADGSRPAPGATPAFTLRIVSTPSTTGEL